jgi:hypothetical protein
MYKNTRVFEWNVVLKFESNRWRSFGDSFRLHRFLATSICPYVCKNTRVFQCNVVFTFERNRWRTFGDCFRLHRFLATSRCPYVCKSTRVFECDVVLKVESNRWRTFGDCFRLQRFLARYRSPYITAPLRMVDRRMVFSRYTCVWWRLHCFLDSCMFVNVGRVFWDSCRPQRVIITPVLWMYWSVWGRRFDVCSCYRPRSRKMFVRWSMGAVWMT